MIVSFQHLPIKRKLMAVMMLASSTALLLACLGFVTFQMIGFIRSEKQNLATLGDVIAANSTAALSFHDQASAVETLHGLGAEPRILRACLYGRDGSLFATYYRGGIQPSCPAMVPSGSAQLIEHGRLTVSRDVVLDGERIGTLCLQADLAPEVMAYLRRAAIILVSVMGASLLATLGLSRKLQRFISDPILRLATVARIVTDKKDYSVRAEQESHDETGLLTAVFNEMLGQIQQRDGALRLANEELEKRVLERAEELRASEATIRSVFLAAPVGICILKDRVIQSANEYWSETFGHPKESIIGRSPRLFYESDEEFERAGHELYDHLKDRGVQWIETRLRHGDGSFRNVVINAALLRRGDPSAGVVVVIHDITEVKRAEEALHLSEQQLRQSQKMEAMGRLAGGVAHDFNNLLTVMAGYCGILLDETDPAHPNRRCIEEIQQAAERAAALTRQLLAFSRKQVLQPKVLDLNEVVSGLDKMLRRLIGEDIELRTDLQPDLDHVKADPGQIEQVVMNLAVNARDAMPRGGKLTIQTSNLLLDSSTFEGDRELVAGCYVMLAVTDTGIGMGDDVKAHLFEPFFTTKGVGKGTGLGLATCYGIIKQSGGDIRVYSEPGHGTTFKIYLPRVSEKAAGAGGASRTAALPRGTETILVVEDEPGVRRLTCATLRTCGYNVIESCDGADGLRVAREHDLQKIDLAVSDVIMPNMSGKELADQLRVLRPDMKILLTSGYTDDALAHHGVLEAGLAFLEKPFSRASLAQKVRDVLDERQ
ncbi:MAG TPA: ATP-binding protein [Verrucomicrobiae bacterium]|nr:ATP-binding protein [Verrucomicrobiae bacterium]